MNDQAGLWTIFMAPAKREGRRPSPQGVWMTPPLFAPLDLGPVRLENRLVVSPMCQYSAADGCMTDWHVQHLMTMAMSGAGLVVVEATGVERIGRITHGDTGLYSDDNERAMARVLAAARTVALPGTKFGIQLAHAGRKASARRPWEGGTPLTAHDDAWPTVAASAIALDDGWHVPAELDEAGLERVRLAFVQAVRRAARLGFEVIELHMAHGYLLHSFQSPISNRRRDAWGGDRDGRMAFPLSVARAVRQAVPAEVALGARITGSDWVEGGLDVDDAVAMAAALKGAGFDFVCVSSGGISLKARIPLGPGYQVPFAARVKAETGITTRAVGLIADPRQADDIVAKGQADFVALARAMLDNPRWGWHAAEALGADCPRPPQYERAKPALWPGARIARPATEPPRLAKAG
jgi:2,4-dienoyl-CoA reductase-like NADH-dependent reductase (Old Yellow Enzyme family)